MVWSCSPHTPGHCCLPRNPLVGQSQAPSMPREPACCWHRHLQSGAAMSCTSPTDMGCSWYYNISEGATYTPTSSSKGKRGTVLSLCSFLSKSNVQRQVKQALWGVQADFSPPFSLFAQGCELTMPKKGEEKPLLLMPCLRWADRTRGTQRCVSIQAADLPTRKEAQLGAKGIA